MYDGLQIANVFMQFLTNHHQLYKRTGIRSRATNALCTFVTIQPPFSGKVKGVKKVANQMETKQPTKIVYPVARRLRRRLCMGEHKSRK